MVLRNFLLVPSFVFTLPPPSFTWSKFVFSHVLKRKLQPEENGRSGKTCSQKTYRKLNLFYVYYKRQKLLETWNL